MQEMKMVNGPPGVSATVSKKRKYTKQTVKKNDILEDSSIEKQKLKNEERLLLEHLNNQIEDPYSLIESYFKGKYLERLVRHQIESYNHFVNYQIQKTIDMFNPVKIHSENDFIQETNKYLLEVYVSFVNFKLYPPLIHENNGATKTMYPQEAKIRNFTYASTMTVDINIDYFFHHSFI